MRHILATFLTATLMMANGFALTQPRRDACAGLKTVTK